MVVLYVHGTITSLAQLIRAALTQHAQSEVVSIVIDGWGAHLSEDVRIMRTIHNELPFAATQASHWAAHFDFEVTWSLALTRMATCSILLLGLICIKLGDILHELGQDLFADSCLLRSCHIPLTLFTLFIIHKRGR